MPLEGQQLGHYRLVRLIGRGSMGEVYLAEDTRINRQVAIKVIRTEVAPYPNANATKEAARLFQREMRAITMLDHPHILPLYDFDLEGLGEPSSSGGLTGSLVLTIAIQEPEELKMDDDEKTVLVSHPTPPNPSALAWGPGLAEQDMPLAKSVDPVLVWGSVLPQQDMPLAKSADNESLTTRKKSQRGRSVLLAVLALVLAVSSIIVGTVTYRNHINEVNMAITATAAYIATDTAAKRNPYPPYTGMLVLSDPLRDNSKGYRWAERSGVCQFRGGAYHISEVQHTLSQTCTAHGLNVSDFAFEVQMTIIKGDCGGLGLRADIAKNNSYILQICADGHYKLLLYVKGSASTMVMQDSVSTAIHTGVGQTNLIAIVATGPNFSLYINHQYVNKGSDSANTLRLLPQITPTSRGSLEPQVLWYSSTLHERSHGAG